MFICLYSEINADEIQNRKVNYNSSKSRYMGKRIAPFGGIIVWA